MRQPLWYILGIVLCSISLFFLILYLNLFTIGYTFGDYVYFIIRRAECYLFLVGLLLFYMAVRKKGMKK